MRSILLSFSLIFLLISCAAKEEKTQIRFVNLDGKPRNIAMRYPEKNVEALNKKMPSENISFDESIDRSINNMVGGKKTPAPQENQATENAAVSYNLPAESAPAESAVVNKDEQNQEVVEYDLSENQSPAKAADKAENKDEKLVIHEVLAEEKPLKNLKNKADKKAFKLAKASPKEVGSAAQSKAKSGKYFVQVGAFSNNSNAQKLLTKMEKFHDGAVKKLSGNDKTVYRVWLGPLKNKDEAAALAKKISAKDQAAIVVKDK
jgi:cell division protein FtsN